MDETAAARATDSTDDIVVARLRRHVPEIAVRWVLDEPERTWRTVEGSLCFADISGFTALSERLEGRGRRGAEELVDTLNRVFGAMLDVAARRGGELLKFGGDALLFLFTGPGHATRAAATAAEMHRGLRRAADEPTAFGRLHLSMSVGVGSGEIHLFLVGDPHRELVLAGPVLDATIVAENRAVAGETLLAPATAAALPAPASTLHGDGHHGVLRWRKAPAAVPERPVAAPPAIAPGELSALLPATLADALGSAVEPGHRSATISFIRLSGTDALLEEEGPAHLAAALDTSVRAVQAALGAEGLTLLTVDVDSDGAKCFCAAGVPAGTEDDEGRMLRALRRVVTAELPLVVQAGVNRGHVFAAEIGGTHRAAYSAMGDATNTAARIAAKAPPGALYAHPAVLERARTRYDSEPAGPFVFKGKSEPLVVYAVGPALGLREDATDQHLPMIGRDAEVAVILAAIARVTTGAGSVLTIAGAAGLGKTRLAQETINTSGLPMLVARSEPYGAASSYHSFRDPLRRLLGIERDDAAAMATSLLAAIDRLAPELRPFAPLLGDVVHIEVPTTPEVEAIASRHRPDRTADIVIDVVRRAHPGPLIVGAEDAQWADEATAHLLTRIEAATVELPWLLVVVRRGGDGGFAPHGGERIVLEPLPDGSIRELTIAATEATPLRPHELAAIVARAAGSPLYVEEWARAAQFAGTFDAVPDSINAVVSAQVDGLPLAARRALGHASVLGRSFRREVFEAVLAAAQRELDEPTRDDLDRFLEADGDERLRFRNGLVRDVVYEALPYRTRGRVHLLAAEAIERASADVAGDAEVLAEHYWLAADAERTWRYSVLAAERARTVSANADAAMYLERALDASRRLDDVADDERYERLLQLGEVRDRAGLLDGALEAYRKAAHLIGADRLARAQLCLRRAHTYERAGAFSVALSECSRSRSLLGESAEPAAAALRAEALAFAALLRQRQERAVEALRLAELAEAEGRRSGALSAEARASNVISWAATMLGRADASQWARRALELYEATDDLVGQADMANNLGIQAYFDGRWGDTLMWYQQSREACERVGNIIDAALTDANIAEVLVNQGRLDEAAPLLREASRVMRASGYRAGAAFAEMHSGRLLIARGELARAEALLRATRADLLAIRRSASAYETSMHLADCLTRAGRPAEALDVLTSAGGLTNDDVSILDATRARLTGEALARLGRYAAAEAELAKGIAIARARELEFELGLLLLVVASLPVSPETGGDEPAAAESARHLDRLGVLSSVAALVGHLQNGSPEPS